MRVTSAKYIDAAHTLCEAVIDGVTYQQVGPGGEIGEQIKAWVAEGNKPDPYVAPLPPVPSSISDRQFFQQLAIGGTITQAEALAAVKVGTIPTVLQGFVDAITEPTQKFAANMLLAGATVFERNHPMTEAIGEAQGMSPDQIDAFFRAAAAL